MTVDYMTANNIKFNNIIIFSPEYNKPLNHELLSRTNYKKIIFLNYLKVLKFLKSKNNNKCFA